MQRIISADLEDVASVWLEHEENCVMCRVGVSCDIEQALVNRLNFDLSLKNDG